MNWTRFQIYRASPDKAFEKLCIEIPFQQKPHRKEITEYPSRKNPILKEI